MAGKVKRGSTATAGRGADGAAVEITAGDLARVVGVSAAMVSRWEKDGMPAGEKEGRRKVFDLAAVLAWLRGRWEKGIEDDEEYTVALTRLTRAKADRAEFARDREREELISRADCERQRMELIRWFISIMERAASELPPRIAGQPVRDARGIITAYFDAVRQQAAESGRQK